MPKYDYVRQIFNRGTNYVNPRNHLIVGQSSRADNVDFTTQSVRRRKGRRRAYKAYNASTGSPSLHKRFYLVDTTGSTSKYTFIAYGAYDGDGGSFTSGFVKANSDWSDASPAGITAFTAINSPNTTDNSLYYQDSAGYDSGPITWTSGALTDAFSSKSWCYLFPTYTSTDDEDNTLNVPMRTDGSKMYLHGLVPPNALVIGDTEGTTMPAESEWKKNIYEAASARVAGEAHDIALDSSGQPHVVYEDSDGDFRHSYRVGTTWTTETFDTGVTGGSNTMSIAIDSEDTIHVAVGLAIPDLVYYYKPDGSSWVSDGAIDTAGGLTWVSIMADSDNVPHVVGDNGASDVGYWNRSSGSWSAEETIATGTYPYGDAKMDTTGVIHIAYIDTAGSVNNVEYAFGNAGSWSTETAHSTDSLLQPIAIAIDEDNTAAVLYRNATAGEYQYSDRSAGTWSTPETVASVGAATPEVVDLEFGSNNEAVAVYGTHATEVGGPRLAIGSSDDFHVITGEANPLISIARRISSSWSTATVATTPPDAMYAYYNSYRYYYKLTAEYSDGRLGESGPSASLIVNLSSPISATNTHTLDLADSANRYDMTDDVTRIYVYRTIEGSESDGLYYRVGSVDCTLGVPDNDFVDNVPDEDLVRILDDDKYLPPKYRTAVMWKDRAVIAQLKCRDTTDEDQLDYEEGGIHKNRIRFSRAFRPDIFPANFFLDVVPDGDAGVIQKLIVNQKSNFLYALLDNDVVAIGGDSVLGESGAPFRPRDIANAKGTPAPNSAIYADGRIFYMTIHGIEMIDGFDGRDITSRTIAPLWNMLDSTHPRYADRINMSAISKVVALYDKKTQRIAWFYPSATSTTNDRAIVLHLDIWKETSYLDGVFSVYSGSFAEVANVSQWNGPGDKGEIFGGNAKAADRPYVYRLDFGDVDHKAPTGGDASDKITLNLETRLESMGRPDLLKRFHSGVLRGRSGGDSGDCDMTVTLDVDDGQLSTALGTDINFSNSNYTVERVPLGFPRTAIGVQVALDISTDEAAAVGDGGPLPWELFELAYVVSNIHTRRR